MKLSEKAKVKSSKSTKSKVDESKVEEPKETKEESITDLWGKPTSPKKKQTFTFDSEDLEEAEYPIVALPKDKTLERPLTLREKKQILRENNELYKFMINEILDRGKDYQIYKSTGKEHIKRSGCIKLATAFGISTEIISVEIEKEYDQEGNLIDIHAHAKAKAIRPWNKSYVIATGTKSRSEYWSDKKQSFGSYNLHNLRTTAGTKASNHAILDAIGFAQVSYDEIG